MTPANDSSSPAPSSASGEQGTYRKAPAREAQDAVVQSSTGSGRGDRYLKTDGSEGGGRQATYDSKGARDAAARQTIRELLRK